MLSVEILFLIFIVIHSVLYITHIQWLILTIPPLPTLSPGEFSFNKRSHRREKSRKSAQNRYSCQLN